VNVKPEKERGDAGCDGRIIYRVQTIHGATGYSRGVILFTGEVGSNGAKLEIWPKPN
jgi:hypothetical protein